MVVVYSFGTFEWRSGMRKLYVPLVVLYLAAWLAVGLPYFSVFLLWLLTVLATGFYDHNENLAVLTDSYSSAQVFLHNKLLLHIKWVMIWFLPVIVLHLVFHWQNLFIVMLITMGLIMLWVFQFWQNTVIIHPVIPGSNKVILPLLLQSCRFYPLDSSFLPAIHYIITSKPCAI